MKFPNFLINIFSARTLLVLAGLFLTNLPVLTQKVPEAGANPTLEQCRNESAASPVPCSGSAWVTGIANAAHSHYAETQYLPTRLSLTGTANTTYTVTLRYDILDSGKHAIDYYGTFNNTESTANPCIATISGCSAGSPTDSIGIPTDTSGALTSAFLGGQVPMPAGAFKIWGGTFDHTFTPQYNTYSAGNSSRMITFKVKPNCAATCSDMVIAWGAHIAWSGDWGPGNSAGNIPGGSYHQHLDTCINFSCGNQDIQLMTAGVLPAALVKIIKYAQTQDGSGVANTAFPFTASASFGTQAFSLVDSFADAPPVLNGAEQDSMAITSFNGTANVVTVTEGSSFGWSLANVNCTSNFAGSVVFTNNPVPNPMITATLTGPGGLVTCEFTNSQLNTTAAPANITGQVLNSGGMALRGVSVVLTNVSTGEIRTATTNSFGYYTFTDLTTENLYRIAPVDSKRYQFGNSVRMFTLMEDMAGVNFFASDF